MIPEPVARPVGSLHQDPRVFAKIALNYGDQNAKRLKQGRKNYQGVVDLYGGKK